MKIVHIIASMNPTSGGPCQGIRNLNSALEENGVSREVVCLDDPNESFIGSDPFIIHALGRGVTSWQYNSKLYHWLIENLPRFDVAIVNGIWLYHLYAVVKALKDLRSKNYKFQNSSSNFPKLFIMPHGMLDPYFQKAPGRRIKALRNWIYWKMIESENINSAYGLLFTCEEELKLARLTFSPYKPKREYNVGYGVPEPPPFVIGVEKDFRGNFPKLQNRPFLLFLSRIHKKKGIDLLIRAYQDVYLKSKNSKKELPALLIAGPGLETAYGKKMRALVGSMGVKNAIFFSEMLLGKDKWQAFHSCAAFVLPSHQENFGISVVEALSCSKPVLITNQINISREIENCKAGFVADDTLEGVKRLLNFWFDLEEANIKEMEKNARGCYECNFSIKKVASQLIRVINPFTI